MARWFRAVNSMAVPNHYAVGIVRFLNKETLAACMNRTPVRCLFRCATKRPT